MKHLVCGLIAAVGMLIASHPGLAADAAPVVVKQKHYDVVIGADRHATTTLRLELHAANDAAAADIGEQPVPFNDAMQTLEIVEAYTLKPDGRRLPVAPDAIHLQQRRESPQQSLYNDLRQKVVIFPSVAGGDSIVLTARWHQVQHYIPGHFFFAEQVPTDGVIEDGSETIIAPKDILLHVERDGGDFAIEERGDTVHYRWRYTSSGAPTGEREPWIDPDHYGQRLFISSLKSYEELGRVYAEVALPKVAVTPAIQELADELTAGITEKREQARRLYEWVSRNIRFVALEFGASSIIPHEAGSVLERGYGDCKDHSVLLMALLKAKGIASELVLIDTGTKYTLTSVPMVAQFNHVIVYLPAFDLYVDATAAVAPFGVLPFGQHGKPVVHAIMSGDVVRRTPVLQPTTLRLTSDAHFESDGTRVEDSTIEADGPFSIAIRRSRMAIQSEGPSRYVAARMQRSGFGATGTFDFADPLALGPSYTIRSRTRYEPRPEWLSGKEAFGMPRAFVSTPFPGEFLMGPLSQRGLREDEPTVCYSGSILEEMSLVPPPGRRFAERPEDIRIATANLEFTSRWSEVGDKLIQHRSFTSRIDQPLCTGEVRKETHKALIEIGEYYRRAVLHLAPEQVN